MKELIQQNEYIMDIVESSLKNVEILRASNHHRRLSDEQFFNEFVRLSLKLQRQIGKTNAAHELFFMYDDSYLIVNSMWMKDDFRNLESSIRDRILVLNDNLPIALHTLVEEGKFNGGMIIVDSPGSSFCRDIQHTLDNCIRVISYNTKLYIELH